MVAWLEVTMFWYNVLSPFNLVLNSLHFNMRKAKRFVSMPGHVRPHYHSKERSLSRHLSNGLFCDLFLWMKDKKANYNAMNKMASLVLFVLCYVLVPRVAGSFIQQQWRCPSWTWWSGTNMEHEIPERVPRIRIPLSGKLLQSTWNSKCCFKGVSSKELRSAAASGVPFF